MCIASAEHSLVMLSTGVLVYNLRTKHSADLGWPVPECLYSGLEAKDDGGGEW